MINFKKLGFIFISLFSSNSFADKNEFFFVENNIDNEYFITTSKLSPRFTGSNEFAKFVEKHASLGYMGMGTWKVGKNYYGDIWLENSPIREPFTGNRCRRDQSGCPDTALNAAEYILADGAYHIPAFNNDGQSNNARGIFSNSSYLFFDKMAVNTQTTLDYRFCSTNKFYDPSRGQRCVDVEPKNEEKTIYDLTKVGHLKLISTNALQEIFVDSNGNAILGLGSKFCSITTIANVSGVSCRLVESELKGSLISTIRISLNIDPMLGFDPKSATIKIKGSNFTKWYNYNDRTYATNILSAGENGIDVFFSQTFLKELITRKIDLSKSQQLFTFSFDNKTVAPQSGYYEFTPSNTIIIKPRDYGISIVSKELVNNPHREGKVGDKEPPLTFDYIVTTSAFRQANKITAAVEGPQVTLRGQPYCLFSSRDKKINVPFSAYLTYTNESGSKVKTRTACDNVPISIKEALWTQTTWPYPYQLEGYFYRTDLQLTFPMNEGTSLFSMEGEDWIGVVEASGYVNVFAEWSGTDVH